MCPNKSSTNCAWWPQWRVFWCPTTSKNSHLSFILMVSIGNCGKLNNAFSTTAEKRNASWFSITNSSWRNALKLHLIVYWHLQNILDNNHSHVSPHSYVSICDPLVGLLPATEGFLSAVSVVVRHSHMSQVPWANKTVSQQELHVLQKFPAVGGHRERNAH